MFDKIPSIKDFIIYLVPGILISYFGLNIINYFLGNQTDINTDIVSKNSVLTFVGIIFSFLIGFLLSQLQIIVYNGFLNNRNTQLRIISSTSMHNEFKEKIARQVIKVFNLSELTINDVLNDPQILYLCLNYVKINSNDESHSFINRSSYLSSFASTVTLPVMLGSWNLLLGMNIPICWTIIFLILILAFVIILTFKIIINFRREWLNSIYRQFLILSLKAS